MDCKNVLFMYVPDKMAARRQQQIEPVFSLIFTQNSFKYFKISFKFPAEQQMLQYCYFTL